jgi:hypothetical protein
MAKEEIEELMKEKPQIWEGGGMYSDKICICGHEEKYHHNHKDHAWGTYSWCRRCMMCNWNGKESCYTFTTIEEVKEMHKKGMLKEGYYKKLKRKIKARK